MVTCVVFKSIQRNILRSSQRIWLPVLIICLVICERYYYREKCYGIPLSSPLQAVTTTSTRRMTNLSIQQINGNVSLTNQLWNVETPNIEQIYLLKSFLAKIHVFNYTNVEMFRIELRRKMGSFFKDYLVIDQHNTPKNYKFTFGSKKKSRSVLISEDIHRLLPNNVTYGAISRCSVVGNSGLIINSSCGKHIDKADYVFRCNAVPVEAYAGDAGNKTNFTTFNPSILHTRYQKLSKPESVSNFLTDMEEFREIVWAPCFTSTSMKECIEVIKFYNVSANKFFLGYPTHFQKVQEFWKSRGLKKRISTGLYLVTVALGRCREVHLYGFWPFSKIVDKTIKDTPYHYFDKAKYNFNDKNAIHSMHSEFFLLVQLHSLGVLNIHIGECTHELTS